MGVINRLSGIFQPITVTAKASNLTHKGVTSKSQRLMLELGILQQANTGCFHYLPLGLKSLNKLINLVDEELQNIGGQKMIFPTLVKSDLWEKSGRASEMGPELLTLQDRRDHKYILAPTHEETASHLLSSIAPISYKNLPLLLYQITSKFRDEMKPRFGLIRSREFIMKDMYSFDLTQDTALETYEKVCSSYNKIFKKIGVKFIKVLGHSGTMGGNLSHEYHFLTDKGEDKIVKCSKCDFIGNQEVLTDTGCLKCKSENSLTYETGIEVAHTFMLGEKYSKPLEANCIDKNTKKHTLQMGSYGIGISRIIAASLECLSLEKELRWPDRIAPYNVIILPPKLGSKEESLIGNLGEKLYHNLESAFPCLKNNVLLDDRTSYTIGRRFIDAKRTGYRYIIVLNKKCGDAIPLYELNDLHKDQQLYLSENDLAKYIKENTDFE
ncbi:probable proline--tRNA ligase, mitochondrial [Sitophilus oryzae]|uniref:Probable proline--tRNA ligase, mitochondrial n=1 Tax=Sitophilus oryzae TaxID=7048 RepID=A0A6J2XPW6_SITOR|nr:probable proline--tRNA ligase, mitochondrial [Sitophilus oryzae]